MHKNIRRKRMQKLNLTLAAVATLALIGCGGGSSSNSGSSNDGFKIYKVEYSLNGTNLPSCPNAHITTTPAQNNSDIGIQNCTWICGDYQGSTMAVSLSFQQNGKNGIWEFDGEVLQTAPAQCHN